MHDIARTDAPPRTAAKPAEPKDRHVRLFTIDPRDLIPSPENERLYRPVDPEDKAIRGLAASIAEHGVREPLVATLDHYILSGHRRREAAKLAGLDAVPVRIEPFRRTDGPDRFIRLLREHNRQRVKTRSEAIREAVLDADPDEAYSALLRHRERKETPADERNLEIGGKLRRKAISEAKQPMLKAVVKVVEDSRKYWPLSDRRIHYALLNDPPLRHAAKPESRYRNSQRCYNDLCDLLTRARVFGDVSMSAIDDDTRPQLEWDVHGGVGEFIERELDVMFKGFRRDLTQSQPDHIEILCEKNTVLPLIRGVAGRYGIPLTSGRGYSSLPPRYKIVQRFTRSGKDRLVMIVVSDFDPEGEDIPHSFARSLRDDFGAQNVVCRKAALTAEQVKRFNLPPQMDAKESSSRYKRFVAANGTSVFELEALTPVQIQTALREAIDDAIDSDLLNRELDAEKRDAAHLDVLRREAHGTLEAAAILLDEEDG